MPKKPQSQNDPTRQDVDSSLARSIDILSKGAATGSVSDRDKRELKKSAQVIGQWIDLLKEDELCRQQALYWWACVVYEQVLPDFDILLCRPEEHPDPVSSWIQAHAKWTRLTGLPPLNPCDSDAWHVAAVRAGIDPLEATRILDHFSDVEMKNLARVVISYARHLRPSSPPRGNLTPSQQAIVDVLVATGHRLTQSGILDALAAANLNASEGMTKQTLAVLVQFGVLTQSANANPRGYGLPEWG